MLSEKFLIMVESEGVFFFVLILKNTSIFRDRMKLVKIHPSKERKNWKNERDGKKISRNYKYMKVYLL